MSGNDCRRRRPAVKGSGRGKGGKVSGLAGDMRRALDERQFFLHFQPKIHAGSGRVAGVEALVRWQHPEHGMMMPDSFIPIAEASGHIVALGEWVLQAACRQAVAWRAAGLPLLPVSVNVSAVQLRRAEVVDVVSRAAEDSGLEPALLELEITESSLMEDVVAATEILGQLRTRGFRLSIDDFGTGYSSLAYLKWIPAHVLKIDQAFVRDVASRPADAAIARTIIALGHDLQMELVAEGVETAAQLAVLRHEGCGQIQGNYVSPPLPADDFASWFRSPAFVV